MRLALAVLAALALLASPAAALDTVVKRIRTSKAQVEYHIKTTRALGTGREGVVTTVTRWSCKGYNKSKSGKARTWRCTLWSGQCSTYYRLGKVRRVTDRGVEYVDWSNERLRPYRCPPGS